MILIYPDYNCFQRGFDDPLQVKIQMEALACASIFFNAEMKSFKLVWSFMHEDENRLCPFIERRIEVERLSALCRKRIEPNDEIYITAREFQQSANLSSKDAIHLACAEYANCTYFLTCDEELIKRAARLTLEIKVMNPVDYIKQAG